jgi:hypothetical protein
MSRSVSFILAIAGDLGLYAMKLSGGKAKGLKKRGFFGLQSFRSMVRMDDKGRFDLRPTLT